MENQDAILEVSRPLINKYVMFFILFLVFNKNKFYVY